MAQLLNRFQVANELELLISKAKDYLILISPYIKLNQELIKALNTHKQNKKFVLIIVYGKNEDDKRKSLSDNDMEFFKTFPNVEIRYNNRLHAKIYLNEKKCLITSLNLHDFSLKENIEVGILTKSRTLDILREFARSVSVSKNLIADSMDRQTADFAEEILEKSPKEFEKKVIMERRFWGLFKKTGESEIILNKPGPVSASGQDK